MADHEFKDALEDRNELDLTVTGRRSGRESSRPIWFVQEGDRLLLLPVSGSDSGWYRNVEKTPDVRLTANGAELRATATLVDDPSRVADVVEKFGQKYGADRVDEYYPKQNAAVEVPLS
ncbi:MAG TPA: nitroreductase/quinone reductase family protein [Solirubrobacterales bacterium]|jgi:deazaflavin-dependent oxidoreductase (nitroreductase family)